MVKLRISTIFRYGSSGNSTLASSTILRAASPMISSRRTTESCNWMSFANSSSEIRSTYGIARRADTRMSWRNPLLCNVKHHRRAQDRRLADWIQTSFDGASCQQIDRPTEQRPQFVSHIRKVEQRSPRIGREGDENIHIALRPEVIAHHAAEKGELRHLPPAAEVAELLFVV